MGFDLYFRNLTETDLAEISERAERVAGEDAENKDAVERINMIYNALRGTGVYERASVHVMEALRSELRAQGAKQLADAFETTSGDLEPMMILDELKGVSIVPTRPPDHEHMTPLDDAGVGGHTARGDLVSMSDAEWAFLWSRFLAFLVRAASFGDGVAIS